MCGTDTRIDRSELTLTGHEWKQKVARSFGLAADGYDEHAVVQLHIARTLSDWMRDHISANQVNDGLEIGCGTGFLTEPLLSDFPNSRWLITDIADEMVACCRRRFAEFDNATFAALDGERPDQLNQNNEQNDDDQDNDEAFDLIVSNLAFQWFDDVPGSAAKLASRLRPSGWMFFSTLAPDNFAGLYDQFPNAGLQDHSSVAVDHAVIATALAKACRGNVLVRFATVKPMYENLGAFLRSLKAIGAGVSRKNHELSNEQGNAKLRSALIQSANDSQPLVADYRIQMFAVQKSERTA